MKSSTPLSDKERRSRSDAQLVQNINRSIRTDFGGVPDAELHLAAMIRTEFPEIQLRKSLDLAKFVHGVARTQVEGIRKRTSHDREELLRRLS